MLSRVGLSGVAQGFPGEPGFPAVEARAIGATCAGVRVWSIYAPNGRTPDSPHYAYKLAWFAADNLSESARRANHPGTQGRSEIGPHQIRR